MKTSINGLNLIKQFEGCRLTAYLCPAKIWTIGYGNTFYPSGTPVKKGDVITQKIADQMFLNILVDYEKQINSFKFNVNQNQFDSLVSLVYNIGIGTLKRSGLPKMILTNPNCININTEWSKFIYSKGTMLPGLVRRRKLELELYFRK